MMATNERFKPIKGYENYLISDFGRVYNSSRKKFRKLNTARGGYLQVDIWKDGARKVFRVHRLVAMHFIDGDQSLEVNHIDYDRKNNHYSNLEWVTSQENTAHSYHRIVAGRWSKR